MYLNEKLLVQINEEVINILFKKLGLADTFKFINQFSKGFGDYTKERLELFPSDNLQELIRDIKSKRKKKKIN